MRGQDGAERQDVGGCPGVALPVLQVDQDAQMRYRGEEAGGLPGLASGQGPPGRHGGWRQELQEGRRAEPQLAARGPLPRSNNAIEGEANAQIRSMLRDHRGLSRLRRMKAVFWWCYMHTEEPMPYREMLERMPTDEGIAELYRKHVWGKRGEPDVEQWGAGLVWEELHGSG